MHLQRKLKTIVLIIVIVLGIYLYYWDVIRNTHTHHVTSMEGSLLNVKSQNVRLPDVILIGSKKCGTGAFVSFLSRHPDICRAKSEIHYFDWNRDKDLLWYSKQFPKCSPNELMMEKTPRYFVTPTAAKDIYSMNSSIKLMLILRDPTQRLISEYVHNCLRKDCDSFEETVLDSKSHSGLQLEYEPLNTSIYIKHLLNYLEYFPLSQIHIIDGEEFANNPLPELKKVEKYLNIKNYFTEDHFDYSDKKGFYCMVDEDGEEHCLGKHQGREHPDVRPDVLKKLQDFYRPFNEKLFELIQKRFEWS